MWTVNAKAGELQTTVQRSHSTAALVDVGGQRRGTLPLARGSKGVWGAEMPQLQLGRGDTGSSLRRGEQLGRVLRALPPEEPHWPRQHLGAPARVPVGTAGLQRVRPVVLLTEPALASRS